MCCAARTSWYGAAAAGDGGVFVKKLVFFAAVLLLPAALWSVDLIGLRIGPTVLYNHDIEPEAGVSFPDVSELSIGDFSFGVDSRFNLAVFELYTLTLVETMADDAGEIYGAVVNAGVGAGVTVPFFDLLQVGIHAGPTLSFAFTRDGAVLEESDFPGSADELFASNLFLRLTADILLGGVSVGGTYVIDTRTNLNDMFQGAFEVSSLFESLLGRAGLSVLFTLF
jgi:hypothetical protein